MRARTKRKRQSTAKVNAINAKRQSRPSVSSNNGLAPKAVPLRIVVDDNPKDATRLSLYERVSRDLSALCPSVEVSDAPPWPEPLREEAFHGLAGEIVRTIEPHTEADPAALLLQFLVAFGNVIDRRPHFQAERDRHSLNLFAVLVGTTSKGRKGTSLSHIRRLMAVAAPDWERDRISSGLSSGEGLIHAVRDPLGSDPGVIDKRLFVVESEFASTLRVLARDGNTLSPVIRLAWDGGRLQVMTKNSPATATEAHISIVAHVTKDELKRELIRSEAGNGFANRFLWCCTKRSKMLPEGGNVPEAELQRIEEKLKEAVALASCFGKEELKRDNLAKILWRQAYTNLSEGKPGLLGAVTSRAEAQVMRLGCIYALLDQVSEVRRQHLLAALAVWDYCEASARFIFGGALGDPVADHILRLLRSRPQGMTRTEINDALGRNRSATEIVRALTLLLESKFAAAKKEDTAGRPAERWFACQT